MKYWIFDGKQALKLNKNLLNYLQRKSAAAICTDANEATQGFVFYR